MKPNQMNASDKLTTVLTSSLLLALVTLGVISAIPSEAQNVQPVYYPNYRPAPVQPYQTVPYYMAQNTQRPPVQYPTPYQTQAPQPSGGYRPSYIPPQQPVQTAPVQTNPSNTLPVGGAPDRENILMILDASESMSAPLNKNESKMVAAKRTVLQVLQSTPQNVAIGLRVYGTYKALNGKMIGAACHATQLVAPITTNNRYQISSELIRIQPTGLTPIGYSLQQALLHDFNGVQGKKSIVLVTDGMETCEVDPCDVAVAMVRSGADVKINVVGYGFHNVNDMKQLKCVALATKGKFYTANTSAQLANSLGELLGAQKSVQAQIIIPNQGR